MALIVEDGTGKSDAESYIDRTFLDDFVSEWGLGDSSTEDIEDVEAAMRRGTLIFDTVYGPRFLPVQGTYYSGYWYAPVSLAAPVNAAQALIFPMTGLVDRRNYELPVLPVQVKQATAALSWQELQQPMSMFPVVSTGKIKKFVKVDKVEVEYDVSGGGTGTIYGARPILSIVEGILAPIGGATYNSSLALYGSAERG